MAWTCVRCQKRIFEPREKAIRFAFQWKYILKYGELVIDLKNLKSIGRKSTITHLECPRAEEPGFKDRMRKELRMPSTLDHPLLF